MTEQLRSGCGEAGLAGERIPEERLTHNGESRQRSSASFHATGEFAYRGIAAGLE
jgi:hypothetical protein